MADEQLLSLQSLLSEFNDLSLSDFRDALYEIARRKNPAVDRYMVEELKNFRGNRTMRSVLASALAEREDEAYIEDFASVIEKETEVSLCKESILGLVRIGTQESIQKLEFLAASKPNATISSLLRQELDKLKHAEKEPAAYYLNQISQGNSNARNCIHAAKVLIKFGDPKVLDEIFEKFDSYDDLARAESANVLSQLGKLTHFESAIDVMDRYHKVYKRNLAFIDEMEEMDQMPKDERIDLLKKNALEILSEEQEPLFKQFLHSLERGNEEEVDQAMASILELGEPIGLAYYMKSIKLFTMNKVAHGTQYHEDTLKGSRSRQSRLRHLVGRLSYAIGKIGGQGSVDESLRLRGIKWLTVMIGSHDDDVCKLALYGTSFIAKPIDTGLLDATLEAHQIEGMTRLISSLERKEDDFTEFFLHVAMKHEILDIQEMAMRALGANEEVYRRIREMLNDNSPEMMRMAIRIIGEIKTTKFMEDIKGLLEGQSDIIRIEVINTLGKIGETSVLNLVNDVILDAKSPLLIECCLKAMAAIGGDEAIKLLYNFAEKTRNRKNAVTAIGLLIGSYKNWANPLPEESNTLLMNHLKPWMEDRDTKIRFEAYRIAGTVISLDLTLYDQLKLMFKEVSTKLRGQKTWDKDEMELVDKWVRTLNRNYFYLKDLLEFQKKISGLCRSYDNPSSSVRTNAIEKLTKALESNNTFLLSDQNELEIEKAVLTALELGEASWREQQMCFILAGYSTSPVLIKELAGRVKSVPKQAKNALMDALARMGMGLKEIHEMTRVRRVLVLEGSKFFRKRVVNFLTEKGYEVRDTDDLDVAKVMIQSEVPECIVSEITFATPCDGAAFMEEIAKEYGAKIQIIFSTNHRERTVIERVCQIRPKKIFNKPFPMEQLDEVIQA